MKRLSLCVTFILACLAVRSARADETVPARLAGVQRIVFLGDSITYAGGYVDYIEAVVRTRGPGWRGEMLDLGLPSETVSGLSEPGHAGGKFPRPVLRERLDRVLAQTQPDLVIACYGINDGIYFPYSDERFAKFQAGLEHLRARAAAAHASVMLVTPPVFDPRPIPDKIRPAELAADPKKMFAGYNGVLDRYSAWLIAQRADGWVVIDAHGPMNAALATRRQAEPDFTFAKDGVHPTASGHALIAQAILAAWGCSAADAALPLSLATAPESELLKLIRTRRKLLSDAWLTATGHLRPGMTAGRPLAEAVAEAAKLETQIRQEPAGAR